jgi:hypothetical protein
VHRARPPYAGPAARQTTWSYRLRPAAGGSSGTTRTPRRGPARFALPTKVDKAIDARAGLGDLLKAAVGARTRRQARRWSGSRGTGKNRVTNGKRRRTQGESAGLSTHLGTSLALDRVPEPELWPSSAARTALVALDALGLFRLGRNSELFGRARLCLLTQFLPAPLRARPPDRRPSTGDPNPPIHQPHAGRHRWRRVSR